MTIAHEGHFRAHGRVTGIVVAASPATLVDLFPSWVDFAPARFSTAAAIGRMLAHPGRADTP